jgi:hypothetical protein
MLQHLLGTTSENVMLIYYLLTTNWKFFIKLRIVRVIVFLLMIASLAAGMKVICAADVHDLCHSLPNEECHAVGKKNFGR